MRGGAADAGTGRGATPVLVRCAGGGLVLGLLAGLYLVDRERPFPWLSMGLVGLLAVLSAYELSRMQRASDAGSLMWFSVAGVALLVGVRILAHGLGRPAFEWTMLAFALLAVLSLSIETVRSDPAAGARRSQAAILNLCVALLFCYLVDILASLPAPAGLEAALFVVLVSKSNDIGGYLAGKAIGGPKLLERISPNKTWAGSVGGALLSCAVALVLHGPLGWSRGATLAFVFALSVSAATQLGDLAESMLKRAYGFKDSGGSLPTFGGALDMIDSLVFAAPVGYWLGISLGGFSPA